MKLKQNEGDGWDQNYKIIKKIAKFWKLHGIKYSVVVKGRILANSFVEVSQREKFCAVVCMHYCMRFDSYCQ